MVGHYVNNVKALVLQITMYSKVKITSLHLNGIKSSENRNIFKYIMH